MHPQLKKGIRISSILYGICFCISFILYLKVDYTYGHAPAIHHMILIGLFYIAVIWCVFSLLLALVKIHRQLQLGFLVVNGSYLFCLSSFYALYDCEVLKKSFFYF